MRNNETVSNFPTTDELIKEKIEKILATLAARPNRHIQIHKLDIRELILDGLILKEQRDLLWKGKDNPRNIGRVKKDGGLLESLKARLETIADQAEQHLCHNRPPEALHIPIGTVTVIGGEDNIVPVIVADQLAVSPKPVATADEKIDRHTAYQYKYYRTPWEGIYVEERSCIYGDPNIKQEYSLVGENSLPPIYC